MRITLVHPPVADPTAPYVAVPLLAACLRREGHAVDTVDANLEAVSWLLRRDTQAALAARVQARFADLDARPSLDHPGQVAYAALWEGLGPAAWVPDAIEDAVATLRDERAFFDPRAYDRAVLAIDAALDLAGAAFAPLAIDFASWRTPFSFLSPAEIRAEAGPDRDPLHAFLHGPLADRLRAGRPGLVGVSIAFPGQLQPGYALGYAVRAALPGVPLVAGGPALTQVLARLSGDRLAAALGPFDAAVRFEGEDALAGLAREVEAGRAVRGVLDGTRRRDLADLPAPDFSTLPLDRYLSPSPVLPYDAARGCYWGRCAFCHYGLADAGTAAYRARPADRVAADLADLARRHGCRIAYLSEDTLAPRDALALAARLREAGTPVRWATDLRPERALDPARCRDLAAGGLLAASLGVESAAPRVLAAIDKGVRVPGVRAAIDALAAAGIAVEAMAFTGFPGETPAEARATIRFLDAAGDRLSLFMLGRFELTSGSAVARDPGRFGVAEVWDVAGDAMGLGLFWRPAAGEAGDDGGLDDRIEALSAGWCLRRYPWAGSLSTAHTLLYYDRFGPDVFRRLARGPFARPPRTRLPRTRYDPARLAEASAAAEAALWDVLVNGRREVSRAAYDALAAQVPAAVPRRR